MSIPPFPTLSQEKRDIIMHKNEFCKRDTTLEHFGLASHTLCHAHLHIIGIKCRLLENCLRHKSLLKDHFI